MDENEDFLISMYQADVYDSLLDYMEYKKDSILLINLNANKISKFFDQFTTFKIPEVEDTIENDIDGDYF